MNGTVQTTALTGFARHKMDTIKRGEIMRYIVTRWNNSPNNGEFVVEFDNAKSAAYWIAAHSCGNVKSALYFLRYSGSYTASPFQVKKA